MSRRAEGSPDVDVLSSLEELAEALHGDALDLQAGGDFEIHFSQALLQCEQRVRDLMVKCATDA